MAEFRLGGSGFRGTLAHRSAKRDVRLRTSQTETDRPPAGDGRGGGLPQEIGGSGLLRGLDPIERGEVGQDLAECLQTGLGNDDRGSPSARFRDPQVLPFYVFLEIEEELLVLDLVVSGFQDLVHETELPSGDGLPLTCG